jgi:hypothetical protein
LNEFPKDQVENLAQFKNITKKSLLDTRPQLETDFELTLKNFNEREKFRMDLIPKEFFKFNSQKLIDHLCQKSETNFSRPQIPEVFCSLTSFSSHFILVASVPEGPRPPRQWKSTFSPRDTLYTDR